MQILKTMMLSSETKTTKLRRESNGFALESSRPQIANRMMLVCKHMQDLWLEAENLYQVYSFVSLVVTSTNMRSTRRSLCLTTKFATYG